ncbi:unnamed protein product [Rhizoctonia solani]|uniref:Transmembrane protein n=1 Tax=Rhizoctonia solani TaxID=456999 RepID=A0A8H3BFZ1_9AGAM|nr:unnamed protein product [Rhizoctonia solani]
MADIPRVLQTPGAGPSRSRAPDIFVPPPAHLPNSPVAVRARTPTRNDTCVYEEVELGLYLHPAAAATRSSTDKSSTDKSSADKSSTDESSAGRGTPRMGRRGSTGSITSKVSDPGRGLFLTHSEWRTDIITFCLFLTHSEWRTDIITFCSHVRADPSLSNARITHVQARKSRRLPFMHEYLLIFFTSANALRFVMRIDRLGKAGFGSSGEAMGPTTGVGTAIQEVGVYHIQDSQHDVESNANVPWLAMDGVWGSHPVVTLVAWDENKRPDSHHAQNAKFSTSERAMDGVWGSHPVVTLVAWDENKRPDSHHAQNAKFSTSERPLLRDIAGLLEGILLEMPNYHLTTANCYLMTRSSLILLHRCCPTAFACYLGSPTGELISAALLAEPVWAGLLRWYLPFVAAFFMIYYPLLIILHRFLYMSFDCFVTCNAGNKLLRSVVYALHSILDVPLPIGIIHSYMNSLEVQINKLVVNISTQFFRIRSSRAEPVPESVSNQPFSVVVDDAWLVLIGWVVLGSTGAVLMFLATAVEYGILAVFLCVLVIGVWFNFKFGSDGPAELILGQQDSLESMFGAPPAAESSGLV